MVELSELRARLDATDREILEKLKERLDLVAEVASLKAEGLPFLRDHRREGEVLERAEAGARELGLDPVRCREVFRELLAMSVRVQEETLLRRAGADASAANAHRVAYQGTDWSYSHLAARKFFGARAHEMEFVGLPTFAAALREAEGGAVGYALLPIENTTAGSINETYDLLRHTDLAVIGEEVWEVSHCLLGLEGADPAALRRVLSHPQALVQCGRFLASLPGAEPVAFVDTAEAARHVSDQGDPSQAAIASAEAGHHYGLEVLVRGIADQSENWTRFVVVSAIENSLDPRIPSKTSLVLTTPHRHGALAHCLDLLASHGVNLTKLESRPVPHRAWEYMFYLDFEGSLAEDAASAAVAALRAYCPYLRVLGSYPARTTAQGRVESFAEDE